MIPANSLASIRAIVVIVARVVLQQMSKQSKSTCILVYNSMVNIIIIQKKILKLDKNVMEIHIITIDGKLKTHALKDMEYLVLHRISLQ